MQLADAVQKVLANAAKLKASNAGNEANTKVLLINRYSLPSAGIPATSTQLNANTASTTTPASTTR